MAKVVRIVGTIVGAALIVVGALTYNPGLVKLGLSVVTYSNIAATVLDIIAPPRPPTFDSSSPLQFRTDPQAGIPYCFGRTAFAGLQVHGVTAATSGSDKQNILGFAVELSGGGPHQSIETFTADTAVVAFDQGGDGNALAGSGYQNWMAMKYGLGAAAAAALTCSLQAVAFPGWDSAHKLSGHAHALWMLRYDPDGNKYTAGVPQPRWIGKWAKVYDPRLDSTYPGGSGSCRALNESTYVWSRNSALHALTWCLGRWQNGKRTLGIGAPVANIRVAEFVEAANLADANGWGCGAVVWSTDRKWTVLAGMLQACGAVPTMTSAMIGCRMFKPRVAIATITSADILDSLSYSVTKARRDRINTVRPRYRSEEHDWEVITGSTIQVSAYVTADGGERAKGLDLPYVQAEVDQAGFDGNLQAGQLAAYDIVNAREAGPIQFTTGPKFLGLKCGDCITLDVPEEGLSATKLILTADPVFDPASGKISFVAETETDSKHAFALGTSSTPPPPFTPTAADLAPPNPNPAHWQLEAEIGEDGQPYLEVQGLAADPVWETVQVQYRKTSDAGWTLAGLIVDRDYQSARITGVDGNTEYIARVAYQLGPRTGDWLELNTITTDANGLRVEPMGAYSAFASYKLGNTVIWAVASGGDGNSYIRVGSGATVGVPPSDMTKWRKLVDRGEQGEAAIGFVQDASPGAGSFVGQTWYQPTGKIWHYWTGSAWQRFLGDMASSDTNTDGAEFNGGFTLSGDSYTVNVEASYTGTSLDSTICITAFGLTRGETDTVSATTLGRLYVNGSPISPEIPLRYFLSASAAEEQPFSYFARLVGYTGELVIEFKSRRINRDAFPEIQANIIIEEFLL